MKLIDKKTRQGLVEGRTYQMGFAFCKPVEDYLETIQAISPCKDYLNDVVYSELTGEKINAYGLFCKPFGLFKDNKKAYIALQILGSYSNYEKDKQNFNKNYLNSQKFINNFEEQLKIPLSKIEKAEIEGKDVYITTFSKKWLKGTYSISLYSLLLRISQWYDGKQDAMEYVRNFEAYQPDIYLVHSILPKLDKFIEFGKLPIQDFKPFKLKNDCTIHCSGILAFKCEKLGLENNEEEEEDDFYDEND